LRFFATVAESPPNAGRPTTSREFSKDFARSRKRVRTDLKS
jgi:hypothetical protein